MTQRPAQSNPRARDGQMGFTIPADLAERAKGVFRAQYATGEPSYSAFLVTSVLKHVAHLETTHNGGRPWPPVAAADMPRGGRVERGGVAKKTVSTYPTREQGDRIRGTAVGVDLKLGQLITEAVEAAVSDAPTAEPGPIVPGRPLGTSKPTPDSGHSTP